MVARYQRQARVASLMQKRLERRLTRQSAVIINRAIRNVASLILAGDYDIQYVFEEHKRSMQEALYKHYASIVPVSGKLTISQLNEGKKASTNFFLTSILLWMQENALNQANTITDTTRGDIINAIVSGRSEGEGSRAIARRIRKVATLTPSRALTIAITETHNASLYTSIETATNTAQDLNIDLYKKWVPSADERTRESHTAMASHPPIPIKAKFNVGGTMMDRPGDPAGGARNVIRCRCQLTYIDKEDL